MTPDPDSAVHGCEHTVSVSVVMPSGHTHTLSHVTDYDAPQEWDCGTVRIVVKDGHLVTVEPLAAGRHFEDIPIADDDESESAIIEARRKARGRG